jgi:CubicO group peptidase (beta-lactamase class C family)
MSYAFIRRAFTSGRKLSALAITVTLFVLPSCSSVSDVDLGLDLRAQLKRLAVENHVCAVAVAVVRGGRLDRTEAASGCDNGANVDPDSVFQAASLSKQIFAYLVLKLAEQGKIDLDAPVTTYLPNGYLHRPLPFLKQHDGEMQRVTDPELEHVTARMILNHTSGLPNWSKGPLRFDFAPGTQWQYSGEGYLLLQRAVESLTRQPLDVLAQRMVFQPLGMPSSSYVWRAEFAPRFQRGNNGQGRSLSFSDPFAPMSLHTTAADYGRFLASVVSDKKLVEMIVKAPVAVNGAPQIAWGLGWGIEQTGQDTLLFQWGNNTGYRAFVIASVHSGDGVVILTNSDDGMALAAPITRQVLPGDHPVFRFRYVLEGVSGALCEVLSVCR